jgi:glutamate racemase
MPDSTQPIGIFDSGVGGLTVLAQIARRLPSERLVYLGDTARVPYGTKSPDTVARYARACARVLLSNHVKMVVVACNTASAFALEILQDELPLPVLGVIEPGARRAVLSTRNKVVGVIGTAGTVGSGAYQNTLTALEPGLRIHTAPCPLFVPLAEEGWIDGEVPEAIAKKYLDPMLRAGVDTIVLGCTHYPLLKNTIGLAAGPDVVLVDSADATSEVVAEILAGLQIASTTAATDSPRFLVTDSPDSFARLGARFLGHELADIQWVDIA